MIKFVIVLNSIVCYVPILKWVEYMKVQAYILLLIVTTDTLLLAKFYALVVKHLTLVTYPHFVTRDFIMTLIKKLKISSTI